jgi:L-cysteine:1D-myo-inositol 2-amino-2-deoxy-alpha-D-glucopyranoside ligase
LDYGLSVYNSLTRSIDPVVDNPVGVYVCGVTPYDTTHIGHAFTYVVFDVLVRYLRFIGRDVTYVRNVTDIDDDILLRSATRGMNWKELGDTEFARFQNDMVALNNLPPEVEPRATEHTPEMISLIQKLIGNGQAYVADGNVYFDVHSPNCNFGCLCQVPYDAQLQIANERGNFPADPKKKDPLDFVLWQAQKEGEPAWPSPWGDGRPGWHIECSAMSTKYLGETFAIHGGGEDLLFPHHEAEIAQAECATGKPFVRVWMHTGMVYHGEKKMSKSLGNMVFARDLLEEFSSDAIRLHLLNHHFRSEWDYKTERLTPAYPLARLLETTLADADEASTDDIERHAGPFLQAMSENLETPRAIAELEKLAATGDTSAQRAARTLGSKILGLTYAMNGR